MQIDKALHFLAGAVVYALFAQFGIVVAYFAVASAGAFKELVDYVLIKKAEQDGVAAEHSVDPMDFVFTIAGGATFHLCYFIIRSVSCEFSLLYCS